jgi:hypothetical protein
MDISSKNETPLVVNRVEVNWDGPWVPGGILPPGISKTTLDVRPPRSDVAVITFIEEISRKPHTNRLDVSRLKRLAGGFYDVTLAIVSMDSVELRIRKGEGTR